MRAYLPVSQARAGQLLEVGQLAGPVAVWAVDPQWRAGAPQVSEEEWEYEASLLAADNLPDPEGVILAVDIDAAASGQLALDDGRTTLPGPVLLAAVAAVLAADLAWYGVQELPDLIARA